MAATNYITGNEIRADTYNGELGRLDFNLGEKHKLFWDFRHNGRIENRLNVFNNPASGRDLLRINLGSTLDYVYTLMPTTVTNIKLNWTHFREADVSFSDGVKATDLGSPSYVTSNSPNLIIPRLAFSGDAGPPQPQTDRSSGYILMPSPGPILAEFDGLDQDLSRSLSPFDIPDRHTCSATHPIQLFHLRMERAFGCAPVHASRSMSSSAKRHSIHIGSPRLSSGRYPDTLSLCGMLPTTTRETCICELNERLATRSEGRVADR